MYYLYFKLIFSQYREWIIFSLLLFLVSSDAILYEYYQYVCKSTHVEITQYRAGSMCGIQLQHNFRTYTV